MSEDFIEAGRGFGEQEEYSERVQGCQAVHRAAIGILVSQSGTDIGGRLYSRVHRHAAEMRASPAAAQTARATDELSESAESSSHKLVRTGAPEEELPGDAEAALVFGENVDDRERRVPGRQSR